MTVWDMLQPAVIVQLSNENLATTDIGVYKHVLLRSGSLSGT